MNARPLLEILIKASDAYLDAHKDEAKKAKPSEGWKRTTRVKAVAAFLLALPAKHKTAGGSEQTEGEPEIPAYLEKMTGLFFVAAVNASYQKGFNGKNGLYEHIKNCFEKTKRTLNSKLLQIDNDADEETDPYTIVVRENTTNTTQASSTSSSSTSSTATVAQLSNSTSTANEQKIENFETFYKKFSSQPHNDSGTHEHIKKQLNAADFTTDDYLAILRYLDRTCMPTYGKDHEIYFSAIFSAAKEHIETYKAARQKKTAVAMPSTSLAPKDYEPSEYFLKQLNCPDNFKAQYKLLMERLNGHKGITLANVMTALLIKKREELIDRQKVFEKKREKEWQQTHEDLTKLTETIEQIDYIGNLLSLLKSLSPAQEEKNTSTFVECRILLLILALRNNLGTEAFSFYFSKKDIKEVDVGTYGAISCAHEFYTIGSDDTHYFYFQYKETILAERYDYDQRCNVYTFPQISPLNFDLGVIKLRTKLGTSEDRITSAINRIVEKLTALANKQATVEDCLRRLNIEIAEMVEYANLVQRVTQPNEFGFVTDFDEAIDVFNAGVRELINPKSVQSYDSKAEKPEIKADAAIEKLRTEIMAKINAATPDQLRHILAIFSAQQLAPVQSLSSSSVALPLNSSPIHIGASSASVSTSSSCSSSSSSSSTASSSSIAAVVEGSSDALSSNSVTTQFSRG